MLRFKASCLFFKKYTLDRCNLPLLLRIHPVFLQVKAYLNFQKALGRSENRIKTL